MRQSSPPVRPRKAYCKPVVAASVRFKTMALSCTLLPGPICRAGNKHS